MRVCIPVFCETLGYFINIEHITQVILLVDTDIDFMYRQTSAIQRTKSQNLNVSGLVYLAVAFGQFIEARG